MVYLRMIPLGLCGGNQDTTTLLAEEGTALMPAGGPGSKSLKRGRFSCSLGAGQNLMRSNVINQKCTLTWRLRLWVNELNK